MLSFSLCEQEAMGVVCRRRYDVSRINLQRRGGRDGMQITLVLGVRREYSFIGVTMREER